MGGHHVRMQTVIGDGAALLRLSKRIKVAGIGIGTAASLEVVTNAIAVHIGWTIAAAHIEGVELVAIAIAVTGGNAVAATDAALIGDVAKAVAVASGDAAAATHATFIELVSVAIAVASRDAAAAADPTLISDVAKAIAVASGDAVAAADAALIGDVAKAIAVASGDAAAATHTALIELIAIAIAISSGNVRASARVDFTGSAADAAGIIHLARSVIIGRIGVVIARSLIGTALGFIRIANAISIDIREAITATHIDGIKLVAIAVAVAGRNAVAATDAALIGDVAIAVAVASGDATAAAHAALIGVGAIFRGRFTSIGDVEGHSDRVSAAGEVLHIQGAAQNAICGQLRQQHAVVRIGESIGVAIENVPDSTDHIIDHDVTSCCASSWIESRDPILVG